MSNTREFARIYLDSYRQAAQLAAGQIPSQRWNQFENSIMDFVRRIEDAGMDLIEINETIIVEGKE